jgi:hypothetical protein
MFVAGGGGGSDLSTIHQQEGKNNNNFNAITESIEDNSLGLIVEIS